VGRISNVICYITCPPDSRYCFEFCIDPYIASCPTSQHICLSRPTSTHILSVPGIPCARRKRAPYTMREPHKSAPKTRTRTACTIYSSRQELSRPHSNTKNGITKPHKHFQNWKILVQRHQSSAIAKRRGYVRHGIHGLDQITLKHIRLE
jgi:hypothetical protein